MARVTKLSEARLEQLAQSNPVFAPGVENFVAMGGIRALWRGDLAAQLDRLCAEWLGAFRFRPLPAVDDMAGLVGFLAGHYRLEQVDPPFI